MIQAEYFTFLMGFTPFYILKYEGDI